MGPGFTAACNASEVDCHLVDLEPLFKGQHFGSDRTHPDATGAQIIADAWWKAMQENCIAQ
jgi:lysophospholipase L1-like esterase